MSNQVAQSGTPVLLTGTGTVSKVDGNLIGFFCSTTTNGTVVIAEGNAGVASGGTAISGTITPLAGTFYPFPAFCRNGCGVTIANTISVTFFFAA